MTNEQAIRRLEDLQRLYLGNEKFTADIEAIEIAIEALKKQPCEDCTVIKKLSKKCYVEDAYGYTDENIVKKVNEIIDVVNELLSVMPKAESEEEE